MENDRNYQKRKRATGSENDKHTRLENDKKYQREKLAMETEKKKQTRLENARKYKKRKQAEKTVTENQVQIEQSRSNNIVNQQDYLKEFDIKVTGYTRHVFLEINHYSSAFYLISLKLSPNVAK